MAAHELFPPQAVWIGSAHPFDLHEVYLDFRSPAAWTLARLPAHAELRITADSRYRLWLNGEFVGRGPGRCYPWRQSVDCIDVTAYLRAGANTIAVQVYQPGYSHFAYVHRGAAGLLASACGGRGARCSIRASIWRVRRNPSFAELVPRVSIYGSGVELRDLTLDDDWIAPAYDAAQWATPRVVAPLGGAPWVGMQARELPLLVEHEQPLTLLETRSGRPGSAGVPPADAHAFVRSVWPTATQTSVQPNQSQGAIAADIPGFSRESGNVAPAFSRCDGFRRRRLVATRRRCRTRPSAGSSTWARTTPARAGPRSKARAAMKAC